MQPLRRVLCHRGVGFLLMYFTALSPNVVSQWDHEMLFYDVLVLSIYTCCILSPTFVFGGHLWKGMYLSCLFHSAAASRSW